MTTKIGLVGFGRIGKNIFRCIKENPQLDFEIVAISEMNPYGMVY